MIRAIVITNNDAANKPALTTGKAGRAAEEEINHFSIFYYDVTNKVKRK